MTFDESEKATEAELKSYVKNSFDEPVNYGPREAILQLPSVIKAQFYLQQRNRRRENQMISSGFLVSILTLVLVATEFLFDLKTASKQEASMDSQTAKLSSLERNSANTLMATKALTLTSEGMNAALQKQLGLNYAVSLEPIINVGMGRISFQNHGPTEIRIWGQKLGDGKALFEQDGRIMARGATYDIAADVQIHDACDRAYKTRRKITIPLELYITDLKRQQYVVRCSLVAQYNSGRVLPDIVMQELTPFNWDRTNNF